MTEPGPGRKPVLALLMRLLWAAMLVLPAFGARGAVVLTNLHSFQVFPNGWNPAAGLVQGSDGNFYGTTAYGGTNGGFGTVFQISTNGALTNLYLFTGGNDGGNPKAALVQGSDGNFYGTTEGGGTHLYYGTVFKISTNGVLTSLYSFTGNDGNRPNGLVQGSDGNFYGTTAYGGTNGQGTVFRIGTNGVLTSLYSFTGTNDGTGLSAALVQGSDGDFYGTTEGGGTHLYYGTVFKISTNGVLTSLYSFRGGNDGVQPSAALVEGSDGNFYGTTAYGGSSGYGTVFRISTNGACSILYSFTAGSPGANPHAALARGSDGNFYGTTSQGGAYFNWGTVFKISTNGVLTNLYSFTGNDGAGPNGLVQGSDGNFYGTAYSGGTDGPGYSGGGTVFQISTNGALTSLYSFTGNDGEGPNGLVQGSDGNFYGTTSEGGTNNFGTVFTMSTNGVFTRLHSFTGGNDGKNPFGALAQGSDGNFYGTTEYGGSGFGAVFKISTNGALTRLHSLNGGTDGSYPWAGLVLGSDGHFYGTTSSGGTGGNGTVFKITTNGVLTPLHSFTGGTDGGGPLASVVQGTDGNFYGTTQYGGNTNLNGGPGFGTVFKISASGALTRLYSFAGTNGAGPNGLLQGSDGNFYGTTLNGGKNYFAGTVFKISPNGVLTSLYSFTGGNDGVQPSAALVEGGDGNFYGTTAYGGTNLAGTVFKISTNGALTSLYSFAGVKDGADPQAGLVQGSDGSFYGTTFSGGQGNAGTIFRLTLVWAAPVLQAATLNNSTLYLTWSTEVGGTYQLQYNSDLSSSNWTNLGSAVTADGATLSATDSVTNTPGRFYRVAVSP